MNRKVVRLCIFLLAAVSLQAAPIGFMANLGNFEDPPTGSPGTGFAVVVIDSAAHTMDVSASFSGLIGNVTASHIHVINGPGDSNLTDTNGPVATAVPTFPGFPLGVTAGTYSRSFDMTMASSYNPAFVTAATGTTAAAEAALFFAIQQGRAYVNIHTTSFGGGEIRGFLVPVPEPATSGIVAGALAVLAFLRRRFHLEADTGT